MACSTVEIYVLNCKKCNQCHKGHKSLGCIFYGVLLLLLSLWLTLSFKCICCTRVSETVVRGPYSWWKSWLKSVSETFVCGSHIHLSLICNKYPTQRPLHGLTITPPQAPLQPKSHIWLQTRIRKGFKSKLLESANTPSFNQACCITKMQCHVINLCVIVFVDQV